MTSSTTVIGLALLLGLITFTAGVHIGERTAQTVTVLERVR